MKIVALLCMVCALATRAADPPNRDEVIPVLVIGTNTYYNARILRTTESDALIKIQNGIIRAKLSELPKALQEKYPATPTPSKSTSYFVRPAATRHITIDMLIQNLQTRISAVERAKEQLGSESNPTNGTTQLSQSESPEVTRRRMHLERTLTQLQLQLDQFLALKQRNEALANGTKNTSNGAATTVNVSGTGAPATVPESQKAASTTSDTTTEPTTEDQ